MKPTYEIPRHGIKDEQKTEEQKAKDMIEGQKKS